MPPARCGALPGRPEASVVIREDVGRDEGTIEAVMLALVAAREADKTICPSEVARHLGGPDPDEWRRLMLPVRHVAVRLAKQGQVAILRKGVPIADLDGFKGVYRIGRPRDTR